jgi:hypothetical protein
VQPFFGFNTDYFSAPASSCCWSLCSAIYLREFLFLTTVRNLVLSASSRCAWCRKNASILRDNTGSPESPRHPSQFQRAMEMMKGGLFYLLIYSPSFSATQARRRIQSRNTLWTSSKVMPFHTCAITSSISLLEENCRSLRIYWNIPKSQKLRRLIYGESGGYGILEM